MQDGLVAPPAGARLIDLSDRFVLPGLIDLHVHLTSDRAGVEGQLAEVTDSVALRSYEAAWNAGKTLQAGLPRSAIWARTTASRSGCATPSTAAGR